MVNILYGLLLTMELNDPILFWLFVAMIIGAIAITYAYKIRVGLLITVIVAGIFYYISEFPIYILAVTLMAFVLLAIDLFGVANTERHVMNMYNWFYLKYRMRRSKKKVSELGDKNL